MNTRPIEEQSLRMFIGCSQEKMARILGVSSKTIYRWECGKSHPSYLARQKLTDLQKVVKKIQEVIEEGQESKWLNTPNEEFGNQTPLDVMTQGSNGIQEVFNLLGRFAWGTMA